MRPEATHALLDLHRAVGALLRADRRYTEAQGDPAAEPIAYEDRAAARHDLSEAHLRACRELRVDERGWVSS